MNRTVIFVLLGVFMSIVFTLVGEGIAHALGDIPINKAIIFFTSMFLGFFAATIIIRPVRQP